MSQDEVEKEAVPNVRKDTERDSNESNESKDAERDSNESNESKDAERESNESNESKDAERESNVNDASGGKGPEKNFDTPIDQIWGTRRKIFRSKNNAEKARKQTGKMSSQILDFR